MKYLVIFIIFFNYFSVSSQENINTITVRGEYSDEINPDEIIFSFSLYAIEKSNKTSSFEEKELKLKDLMKEYEIPAEKWEISFLWSDNQTVISSNEKYRSKRSYNLTLKNDKNLNSIISKLYDIGFDNIRITNVSSNSINKVKEEFSIKAFDIAQSRAKKICEHIGKDLGNAINIQEIYPTKVNNDNNFVPMFGNVRGTNGATSATYEKLIISYTIEVTFEIK